MAESLSTFDGFAEGVLGMRLYPKQRAVLRALDPPGAQVSFKSCNEGGKTSRVICAAVLGHLALYPDGKIVSTSGSFRQIKDQLLPALHGYATRFPRWSFLKTPRVETEKIHAFWEGFSTNDAGKFEGHHFDGNERPLLIIVDEAKTVKDDIFEAIERCNPTRVLLTSSPGYAEGEFYRSHTTRAKFYQTFTQRAEECPHITAERILKVRAKWGPQHPLVRSMLDAEFMELVEDAIIDLKALEDLMADPPSQQPGETKAFCDFAWSMAGDESVLALRRGNLVTLPLCFRDNNLHGICGRFIAEFKKQRLRAWEIEGDEGGGGKLVIDQLEAMGWPIVRVNNQSAPRFDGHYANLAAETWFDGGMKVARREIILPDDNDLRGQLLDRKRVKNNKGLLAVESKEDMRRRNVPSPDRADAVLGCMTPLIMSRNLTLDGNDPRGNDVLDAIQEQQQDSGNVKQQEGLGIWAG
jgi:phage terminase large subunit